MDPCDSSYLKKKERYPYSLGTLSHSPEDPFDQYVGSIGMQATSSKLLDSTCMPSEGIGVKSLTLNADIFDLNRNQEPSAITTSSTFMGMFQLLHFLKLQTSFVYTCSL